MTCPYCGATITNVQIYCNECGQIVKAPLKESERISAYWEKINDENRFDVLFSGPDNSNGHSKKTLGFFVAIFTFIIIAACFFFFINPVLNSKATANPMASQVIVDGQSIVFEAYQIDDSSYFKIRDLALAMSNSTKKFDVSWDNSNNAINLIKNQPYTTIGGELVAADGQQKEATVSKDKFLLDGKKIRIRTYDIEGEHYVKLRDLGKIMDFNISWDSQTQSITIDTTTSYSEDE